MPSSAPAPATTRRLPTVVVVGLLVAMAALAAALGHQLLASSSTTVVSASSTVSWPSSSGASALDPPRVQHRARLGEADGALPDGATAFDEEIPGIANLDPVLLEALRQATAAAAEAGIELQVNSGWRSPAYQDRLLREAVAEHGSEEAAARWAATPETSLHVSGDAVDVGPPEAASWLAEHGADHGLCPVYENEPWHFELRPEAVDHGCPPLYADPTDDPRMQP